MEYESSIEYAVCARALLEFGVFNIKLRGTERGYPDRLFFMLGGMPLFIEFKRPGCELTEYQKMIHERLRHASYTVEVHDNVEVALRSIREKLDARSRTETGCKVASSALLRSTVPRPR